MSQASRARQRLGERALQVNEYLDSLLVRSPGVPGVITEAMRYSVLPGGKRLRPALVLETAVLLGAAAELFMPAAAAIELIHTYSLIHDDLPAMDDDDLRRGKPSCHKVYGEGIAILAGDALLTLGFEHLAGLAGRFPGKAEHVLRAIGEVSRAIGTEGMIGGQVLDLEAEGRAVQLDELRRIHRLKTGCLFEASMRLPAILLSASGDQLQALTEYAQNFGVAFQITDDILDVVGDPNAMGKSKGSDSAKQKATYPGLLGLDEARVRAREAACRATEALRPFGDRAGFFVDLTALVLERDR